MATTSAAGRKFITEQEGVRLKAYQDSVGIWTVGVGHTSAAGPPSVTSSTVITAAESDQILARDLAKVEAAVSAAVNVPVEQHEYDAMVSLCFNIGNGGFAGSTVVKELNKGNRDKAADAFLMWNKAGGKVLKGLKLRRERERELFLNGHT